MIKICCDRCQKQITDTAATIRITEKRVSDLRMYADGDLYMAECEDEEKQASNNTREITAHQVLNYEPARVYCKECIVKVKKVINGETE